jgi:hypothetical protein
MLHRGLSWIGLKPASLHLEAAEKTTPIFPARASCSDKTIDGFGNNFTRKFYAVFNPTRALLGYVAVFRLLHEGADRYSNTYFTEKFFTIHSGTNFKGFFNVLI